MLLGRRGRVADAPLRSPLSSFYRFFMAFTLRVGALCHPEWLLSERQVLVSF